jgi:hypothetical protein
LNEIIRPEYGFSYKVTFEETETTISPQIFVFSIVEENIELDDEIIVPANSQTLTLGDYLESLRYFDNVRISQVEQSAYDFIRVFSEPVRIMATFKIGDRIGGLTDDWTVSDESVYIGKEDYERQDEKYEKLWSAWKLNVWDGTDYKGVSIIPSVTEADMEVTYLNSSTGRFIYPAHCFDKKLMIKKDESKYDSDYKNPLFFLKGGDDKYFLADKTITDETEEHPSVGMSVMDDAPGIQVKPHLPHMLAKNHGTVTNSEYAQLYDYLDCLFTGSIFSDALLAYRIEGVETSGMPRTKNIHLPGFHYWAAAPETKIDRTETTGSEWTIYKDDREELKKFAALAKAWYGRIRNTVSFTSQNVYAMDALGRMITEVYSGGSFTPVGTVLTSVEYDFINYTLSLATDFSDLDFQKISKRNITSSNKAIQTRMAKIEEQLTGENIRIGKGGGGGGSQIKWAKTTALTGLSTSYVCSVYTSRGDLTAPETSKVVKVWDIIDTMAVGRWFPVQASSVTGFDYECTQQMADI